MSNEDPYGTPPQQPYGAEPGPGSAYGPPPPPKKRTVLIVGAIIAALIVIGALVVGGIVLLGDDDKSDESSATASDEPSEEQSDEPADEPTEEPTEEPTDEGGKILGTNYTYSLPGEGWVDASADARASGTAVDSVAAWGEQLDGSRANVLVEAGSAGGTTLKEARASWEKNLQEGGNSLQRKPNVVIDGEKAYAVELQGTNSSGNEIFQSVYLTIHQDILYSIGFTSQPADDQAEEAFDVVKASWAWTS